jgi:SPP1 gp7 family putative phage head morphogenesis protein
MSNLLAAADILGRAHAAAETSVAAGREFALSSQTFEEILPEGVTPDGAAQYILNKVPMSKPAYLNLLSRNRRQYRDYAFYIAKTENVLLIEAARQAVAAAIEQGTTQEDFRKTMEGVYQKLGVTPLDPWHLETVFRTNVESAYQAGRYRQMTDPDVLKALPYWQYRAIMDSRTRPAHGAMNGFIAPASDPIWKSWYPPNGYNCRCTVTAVGRQDAQKRAEGSSQDLGISALGRLPEVDGVPVRIDKGFDENPILYFEKAFKKRAERPPANLAEFRDYSPMAEFRDLGLARESRN